MTNLDSLSKCIVRSLCSIDASEQQIALQNFENTDFNRLLFLNSGARQAIDLVREFYNQHYLPPGIDFLIEDQKEVNKVDVALWLEGIKTIPQEWGGNYKAILVQWSELYGKHQLDKLATDLQQITAPEGMQNRSAKGTNQILKGVKDAVGYGLSTMIDIQSNVEPRNRAIDNEAGVLMLETEIDKKFNSDESSYHLTMNIPEIDDVTMGAQRGELWMLAGYTSQGKSTFMLNWLYYLMCNGFNAALFSFEMSVDQMWRILGTIHSCNPKWQRPGGYGVPYARLKDGRLSADDYQWYRNVVLPDLKSLPGKIIVKKPSGGTISDVRAMAEVEHQKNPLDIVAVDYFAIMEADRNRKGADRKDRIGDNILKGKQMAQDFAGGDGVVVVSPHQINRAGFEKAKAANGQYEMSALADTAETERTADVILALYHDEVDKLALTSRVSHLKNRDGALAGFFNIRSVPQYRLMGSRNPYKVADYETYLNAV